MLGGITEEELIKWANGRVDQNLQVKKLNSKTLSNGQFFFKLLASVEPQLIDWEIVKPG